MENINFKIGDTVKIYAKVNDEVFVDKILPNYELNGIVKSIRQRQYKHESIYSIEIYSFKIFLIAKKFYVNNHPYHQANEYYEKFESILVKEKEILVILSNKVILREKIKKHE